MVGNVPAFNCQAHFGELCADKGLGVLSPDDMSLALRSGLRVFVYRDVPASFHRDLFLNSRPKEVKSGEVCDFMRAPCTPHDPPEKQPGYSTKLNEWLTGAKHCADVPLLAKLLALGALPGVHTDEPHLAHLFVVPFLGGFVERTSPQMTNVLDREQRQGRGLVDKLLDALPHFTNATATRHLFLLTNSCGGCLRQPCHRCAAWQNGRSGRAGVELAATLGPSWSAMGRRAASPPPPRPWLKQLVVPPNVMDAELHAPLYVPLCDDANGGGGGGGGDGGGGGGARRCRPNTARKEHLVFYQGAHSFNGVRAAILGELDRVVFGKSPSAADSNASRAQRVASGFAAGCDCRANPLCCVNQRYTTPRGVASVAYFYTASHWHPVTPLGFAATIEWMQRSRFCLCPPGDVPYNKRYFTALLAGCVPVIFSFQSQVAGERNWWKPRKGPGQRDIDPFYAQINHSRLAIEVPVESEAGLRGFIARLHAIPDHIVEEKQRAIEAVRHLLLYDMSGARPDAFTCMLRQLVGMLAALPKAQAEEGGRRTELLPPLPFSV